MLRLLVLAAVVCVVVSSDGCKYWCKQPVEPYGKFCCEVKGAPTLPEENHDGDCPPYRLVCPGFKSSAQVCPHDGYCKLHQKCCYDTCLGHTSCKNAENLP